MHNSLDSLIQALETSQKSYLIELLKIFVRCFKLLLCEFSTPNNYNHWQDCLFSAWQHQPSKEIGGAARLMASSRFVSTITERSSSIARNNTQYLRIHMSEMRRIIHTWTCHPTCISPCNHTIACNRNTR